MGRRKIEVAAHGARATAVDPASAPNAPYVLLVGEDHTWFRRDYERAFRELGLHVAFVPTEAVGDGPETGLPGDGLARARARILDSVRALVSEREPTLALFYAYDRSLSAPLLRRIRGLPCPSVLLHVDMVGQWYHSVRSCAAFTRILAAQREHNGALRRRGARVLHWPMAGFATQPDWSVPRPPVVRFVGTPSAARVRALSALVEAGVETEIFGRWNNGEASLGAAPASRSLMSPIGGMLRRARRGLHAVLPILQEEGLRALLQRRGASPLPTEGIPASLRARVRGPVSDAALARTLAGGQVALGCADTAAGTGAGARQMRLRDFEAPLAGACYLTQVSSGLAECFVIGREVLAWDDPQDLIRRARELLADPQRCLEVARAGWERATRDHTYRARLALLFRDLGLSLPGAVA